MAYNLTWGQRPGPHIDECHLVLSAVLYLLIGRVRQPVSANRGNKLNTKVAKIKKKTPQ